MSELRKNKYQQKDEVKAQGELFKRKKREMPDAERLSNLQGKLYQRAKQERTYKFYVLYDKVFLAYVLREAWKRVKANGGKPGVDGMTIADVKAYGVDKYLKELGEELRTQQYRPQAVKRVMIEKPNGGERPLGIPTVRDRIAQTACLMVIEPIYEADFEDSSYGFRPNRSAGDAVRSIKENLKAGNTNVYDADLSKYFDTIPHDKLMIALKERIADPRLLKLIKKWLKTAVYKDGEYTGGKKNKVGTPQGGVISPLLANIYMHLIDRIVNNAHGIFGQQGVKIIRYADDFVLMGRNITEEVTEKLYSLLTRMGLILNKEKTHQLDARKESFKFLGFTFRYDIDMYTKRKRYWNIIPNKTSEIKVRGNIRDYLKSHGHFDAQKVSDGLNSIVRGWLNYYDVEGVSYAAMSKRRLRYYLNNRLYRYYRRKSQRRCKLYGTNAFETLVNQYGLIDPTRYARRADSLVNTRDEFYRKAVCGKIARAD